MSIRIQDAQAQLALLSSSEITFSDIKESVRSSCSLDTGGKFGWSCFGSMASGFALSKEADVRHFDKKFSLGKKSRRLVNHLTVRHSAQIDKNRVLQTGTVAEMILDRGVDKFLSILEPTFRFFYVNLPVYFNHNKDGELKDREISIADPDSRIMLNNAELINGEFGRMTNVD
jgi:hypothetical protein